MPLMPGKSKKVFSKNVETEMESGKPKNQALAIAYSVKRKPKKKMAEGGMAKNESASSESRPMPEERDKDSQMMSRNSDNKSPKNDEWTSNITISQAQKPSITKLSQPKIVGSDAFSVRNRDMHEDEADMMDQIPPESDLAQPPARDNEMDAKKQGSDPDMAKQHNNSKMPYNKAIEDQYAQDMAAAEMKKVQSYAAGGMVNEAVSMDSAEDDRVEHPAGLESDNDQMRPSEDEYMSGHFASGGSVESGSPDMNYADGGSIEDEREEEHHNSIAATIMSKRSKYAEGGKILSHDSIYSDDSDQADLSRNADEDANEEDQVSFNALRKENYSESAGLRQLDNPKDSGQRGDQREMDEENGHDKISKMRSRMNLRRQFSK